MSTPERYENHYWEWREEANEARITNKNYLPPIRPFDDLPEGYCPKCIGYTTNYNRYGECNICGTSLYESEEAAAGWEEDDE